MKYQYFLTWLIFTGIVFFSILSAQAQISVKGKVTDVSNGTPIPFVKIAIGNHSQHFLSNIDGEFEFTIKDSLASLSFSRYLYRTKELNLIGTDTSFNISLVKNKYFEMDDVSSDNALNILNKVLFRKKQNDPSQKKHISYSTYNKATLTPDHVEETNKRMEKFSKFFAFKFNSFKPNQHFIILESYTEKKAYNKNFHKEEIKGAKSTILDVPSLFIQTTQIQSFSPYENYINVGGKLFISPLATHTINRYSFQLTDTIYYNSDTLYVIKYNPIKNKQFDGLKGLLYVNTKNYAIQYFVASPAQDKKLQLSVLQSYKYYPEEDTWFFERTKTVAEVERSGEFFIATLNNYVYKVNTNSYYSKKSFDEVILKYPPHANTQTDSFWVEKRLIPLTLYDSNTYIYYDSADQRKFIKRTLKVGENLYYGVVQYKFLDLDLNRFFDINQVEALRIGFGAHTNALFSDRVVLGGYFGYGFRDQRNKYGMDASYKFRTIPITIQSAFSHDLREAGGTFFPFNRFQYSSEGLRRIRLRIMDLVTEWENSALIHLFKYLDAKISYAVSKHKTTYDYAYKNDTDETFYFTELRAGFRYSYGEQYIQLLDRRVLHKTIFPVFYFQYTRGFDGLPSGQYEYNRFDAKVDYTFEILDWGKTGVQLAAGLVNGDAPYTKLYNNRGSRKNPSIVIHNSFETMQYNEFLSDKYIALFLSHNFGRLYLNNNYFRPTLILLHNIGFGSLRNPQDHRRIDFKTMERGYVESGMLLDEILNLKITGLKIGIGAGFFLRYGPYQIKGFSNNMVAKFALKFGL